MTQHAQDYDELIPKGFANISNWSGIGWASQFCPYVKSVGVYKCPDDSGGNVSYAFNAELNDRQNGGNSALNRFQEPAHTIGLAEITGIGTVNIDQPVEAGSTNHSPIDYGYHLATGDSTLPVSVSGGPHCCINIATLKYVGAVYASGSHGAQDAPQPRHKDSSSFMFLDSQVKYLRGSNVDGSGNPLAMCKVTACYAPE